MTNGRTRDAVGRIDIVSCGTGFPSDTAILALSVSYTHLTLPTILQV